MTKVENQRVAVVIPNWNGADFIKECLNSLIHQSYKCDVVVVENGSTDDSFNILRSYGKDIHLIQNDVNHGFAEGVNIGIRYALENSYEYIALLNNDAIADKFWIENLVATADKNPRLAMVTSRIMSFSGELLDSTGDFYTRWGLPYPRGRGQPAADHYLKSEEVFGASGGASIYRSAALCEIGLFDKTFFAYFEDVDISYRARLYGWEIYYCATAHVYHRISATSTRIKGFTVYQTFKNYLMVFFKNTPLSLLVLSAPFTLFVYFALMFNAAKKRNGIYALKGFLSFLLLFPHVIAERRNIQKNKVVSSDTLKKWITFDVPADQTGIIKIKKLLKL